MPGTVISALYAFSQLTLATAQRENHSHYYLPQFSEKKTEAQKN